jgi:hypothetical protein
MLPGTLAFSMSMHCAAPALLVVMHCASAGGVPAPISSAAAELVASKRRSAPQRGERWLDAWRGHALGPRASEGKMPPWILGESPLIRCGKNYHRDATLNMRAIGACPLIPGFHSLFRATLQKYLSTAACRLSPSHAAVARRRFGFRDIGKDGVVSRAARAHHVFFTMPEPL